MKTSIHRQALIEFFDRSLMITPLEDYAPNGLQVQGKETITRVMTGVTASRDLIQAAIDWQADALFVHHGLFWKGEPQPLVGLKHARIAPLISAGINLFAYHLPLDIHPGWGNNVMLARELSFEVTAQHPAKGISNLLWEGTCESISAAALSKHIHQVLSREPLLISGGTHPIRRLAWCTGGADDFIELAQALGVDAFISGEISEPTVHIARELGIHYFACGHHATERYGVKKMASVLAEKLGLQTCFQDIDNPV